MAKKAKGKADKTKKKSNKSHSKVDPGSEDEDIEAGEIATSNEPSDFNSEAWSSLGVPGDILKALEEQNFSVPTAIQSLTLAPAIMGRRDILGAAETGSGKTLAFGIPILAGILEHKQRQEAEVVSNLKKSKKTDKIKSINGDWSVSNENEENVSSDSENEDELLDDDCSTEEGIGCVKVIDNIEFDELKPVKSTCRKPLYALILTPTRELAIQIKNHLCKAAKYTDIRIAVIVGGMAAVKQERVLSKGPEIVIATPGRLWELIDQGNEHLSQLDTIKYLAIDETDRMLEKGHFKELHQVLEKMNDHEEASKDRQTFVFSATLTMVHEIPDYLQRKKQKNSKSKIFKLTPGQKLQKVIHMLKIKNPKVVDVTKERGQFKIKYMYNI